MKVTVDASARYSYHAHLTLMHAEEWSRHMYRLRTDMGQWLSQMCEMPYRVVYTRGSSMDEFWSGTVQFMSKGDAMAFKLAWS